MRINVKDIEKVYEFNRKKFLNSDLCIILHDPKTDRHFKFPKFNFKETPKVLRKRMKKKLKPEMKKQMGNVISMIGGNTVSGCFKTYLEEWDQDGKPSSYQGQLLEEMFGIWLTRNGKNLINIWLDHMERMGSHPIPMSNLDMEKYTLSERGSMCDIGFQLVTDQNGIETIGISEEFYPQDTTLELVSDKPIERDKIQSFIEKMTDHNLGMMDKMKGWS
tara:strand:- start:51 stop:707 length:657 start_codon:yes stop_codon:yes gene_type:complete